MLRSFFLMTQLLVVCHPEDLLRPVAEEIAAQEHAAVKDSWEGAQGDYLVWVVEPQRLSDKAVIAFTRSWRDQFRNTAVGLIVGQTPRQARELWSRSAQVRGDPAAALDVRSAPVSPKDFLDTVATHGYVTFAGHGGQTFLALGEDTSMKARDLPPLRGLVLGTASCNVFRPWAEDSIALGFAEKGAAAFAGFVYSPEAGYLIGCYRGLPLRWTTPEFPIGRVIQLQNQSAMQAFADLPYYLLLGDPRIHLHRGPLYSHREEENLGDIRIITMHDVPRGFVPLILKDGSAFERIAASGTETARGFPFYNSRLQAMDIGPDKYVLAEHGGGTLTLRLSRSASAGWQVKAAILESLDTLLVFVINSTESAAILILVGLAALGASSAVRSCTLRTALAGAAAGGFLALLHAIWVGSRVPDAVVTSKPLAFSFLPIVATFLLAGCGAIRFLRAPGRRGRLAAVTISSLPGLLPGILHLGVTAAANELLFRPRVGAAVYNYHCALLALTAAVFLAALSYLTFQVTLRAVMRLYLRQAARRSRG